MSVLERVMIGILIGFYLIFNFYIHVYIGRILGVAGCFLVPQRVSSKSHEMPCLEGWSPQVWDFELTPGK